jgi:hypothetical protein
MRDQTLERLVGSEPPVVPSSLASNLPFAIPVEIEGGVEIAPR